MKLYNGKTISEQEVNELEEKLIEIIKDTCNKREVDELPDLEPGYDEYGYITWPGIDDLESLLDFTTMNCKYESLEFHIFTEFTDYIYNYNRELIMTDEEKEQIESGELDIDEYLEGDDYITSEVELKNDVLKIIYNKDKENNNKLYKECLALIQQNNK